MVADCWLGNGGDAERVRGRAGAGQTLLEPLRHGVGAVRIGVHIDHNGDLDARLLLADTLDVIVHAGRRVGEVLDEELPAAARADDEVHVVDAHARLRGEGGGDARLRFRVVVLDAAVGDDVDLHALLDHRAQRVRGRVGAEQEAQRRQSIERLRMERDHGQGDEQQQDHERPPAAALGGGGTLAVVPQPGHLAGRRAEDLRAVERELEDVRIELVLVEQPTLPERRQQVPRPGRRAGGRREGARRRRGLQHRDDRVLLMPVCQLERGRRALLELRHAVGARPQAEPCALDAAKRAAHAERRHAVGAHRAAHVRARQQAELGALDPAEGAAHDERRRALPVGLLDVGAVRDAQPCARNVALVAARQERRPAILGGDVDARAAREQERGALRPVEHAARVQRRAAVEGLPVDKVGVLPGEADEAREAAALLGRVLGRHVVGGAPLRVWREQQPHALEVAVHAAQVQSVAPGIIENQAQVVDRIAEVVERVAQVGRRAGARGLEHCGHVEALVRLAQRAGGAAARCLGQS